MTGLTVGAAAVKYAPPCKGKSGSDNNKNMISIHSQNARVELYPIRLRLFSTFIYL